jgi:hypothetical protein
MVRIANSARNTVWNSVLWGYCSDGGFARVLWRRVEKEYENGDSRCFKFDVRGWSFCPGTGDCGARTVLTARVPSIAAPEANEAGERYSPWVPNCAPAARPIYSA